jgi:hypothetical protein
MAQTAVEWFYNKLIVYMNGDGDFESAQQIYKEAKEMEKEQILNAYRTFADYPYDENDIQQHYNENYSK